MALVTYAQLVSPSKSDPSRSVAAMALARMQDATKPMPPTGALAATDISTFAAWVNGGAKATSCAGSVVPAKSLDASGPECVLASDCPGDLICRNGTCDVECVLDKDCVPTYTCKRARCQPPGLGSGFVLGGADAGDRGDAGGVTTGPVYRDFADSATWSTASVSDLSTGSSTGSAFDGRYVYFAPDGVNGKVLRYDTQASFGASASWAMHDLALTDARAIAYRGAVFDGRYVYLMPSGAGGLVARVDTQASFTSDAAWTLFELPTVNPALKGFTGATFDGRYVYLVPAFGTTAARLDTHADFTSASSWTAFNLKTVAPAATSFAGAVYDGHHVYFVPWGGTGAASGSFVRFDPTGGFADPTSWAALELTTLNAAAHGYHTAAFDGRFLYLVPGWTAPTPIWTTSLLARFDTQATFAEAASWTFYDMVALAPDAGGFNAAAFDGRYVVLSPGSSAGVPRAAAYRYDTTGDMTSAASWSELDTSSLGASLVNLKGAVFDGHYVYFAPARGSVARFEARTSAGTGMPGLPAFYGSFF